jgi:hypothetical protein
MGSWLALILNAAVLTLLLSLWAFRSPAPTTAMRSDAELVQMAIYCQHHPFAIFVNKELPQSGEFMFIRYGTPIVLTSERSTDAPHTSTNDALDGDVDSYETITLSIGENVSLSCVSRIDNDPQVEELMFTHTKGTLVESTTDHNADGLPDLRQHIDHETGMSRLEVWYEGKWRSATAAGSRLKKHLTDGESVSFDMRSGGWILTPDGELQMSDDQIK